MKLLPLSFIAIVTASVTSCMVAPVPPPLPPTTPIQEPVKPELGELTEEQQRQVDAMHARLARQNQLNDPSITGEIPTIAPTEKLKPKAGYPFASPVPGKEGFVFNPYTNNRVDVRDIPRGTLVRDPHDADETHRFRVP